MRPPLKKLVIPQYGWVKLDLPAPRAGTGSRGRTAPTKGE